VTRIYYIKNVPEIVKEFYHKKFPMSEGYTYKFYMYIVNGIKYYASETSKDGKLWDYSTQASIEQYQRMMVSHCDVCGINFSEEPGEHINAEHYEDIHSSESMTRFEETHISECD